MQRARAARARPRALRVIRPHLVGRGAEPFGDAGRSLPSPGSRTAPDGDRANPDDRKCAGCSAQARKLPRRPSARAPLRDPLRWCVRATSGPPACVAAHRESASRAPPASGPALRPTARRVVQTPWLLPVIPPLCSPAVSFQQVVAHLLSVPARPLDLPRVRAKVSDPRIGARRVPLGVVSDAQPVARQHGAALRPQFLAGVCERAAAVLDALQQRQPVQPAGVPRPLAQLARGGLVVARAAGELLFERQYDAIPAEIALRAVMPRALDHRTGLLEHAIGLRVRVPRASPESPGRGGRPSCCSAAETVYRKARG